MNYQAMSGGISLKSLMLRRFLRDFERERARGSALLLLVCLFLPFLQAAVASVQDLDASLPVCCRSHGKHKCFMLAHRTSSRKQNASGIRSASTVSEKCPCVPEGGTTSFHSSTAFPANPALYVLVGDSAGSLTSQTAGPRSSDHNANQKRGPPDSSIAS
jgi:hypothetical protein